MDKALPKGWAGVKMGELYYFIGGGTPSKSNSGYWNGDIPWASIKDISKNEILKETQDFISVEGLERSSANVAEIGEVIIGTRMLPGKAVVTSIKTAINQDLKIVRPKAKVLTMFTYYQFRFLRNVFEQLSFGTTVKGVTIEKLQGVDLLLPPLPEQERIVVKLDKLFAQHEKIKKALDRIPQLLKAFRQQVLTQAVTGKLTEQWREGRELEEWKEENLGNICNLKAGNFIPASEIKHEKAEGLFPCYGGNGLRGYVKSFTHVGRYSLIGRQGALCGNVHLVEGQFHATEHALVAKAHLSIDEIWLFHKLTSLKLNNYSKGVAQPGLSVMNLNSILIEVPPLEEQQEIVRRIESLFAKVDAIEASYHELKQKVDKLPQAILHKAFKGELVPQLPTDGDAKDLLDEILALKKEVKGKKR